jgi:hypothetical protein
VRRILICAALASGLAGCGGDDGYENALRPPAPVNVTAAVGEDRIRVSPARFGAGPVVFVIANESGAPQRLTFETDELAGGAGITRTTRELQDGSTGTFQVDPPEGGYTLSASGDVRPAAIEVGEPRRSSQEDLLLP